MSPTRRPPPTLLVTGSSGLAGSEVCRHFHGLGWAVHGVDNNQRAALFGPEGDTRWNRRLLEAELERFRHHELDVRDRVALPQLLAELRPDAIVHAAAQPSHEKSAEDPLADFDLNAVATLVLLEAARTSCPESPFVFLSTNKVYGDAPNRIALAERETRWDYADPAYAHGIPETLGVDRCVHSPFGVSKLAADAAVQEYGRYFGMPTCALRAGCVTGGRQAGVQLHGFLNYLVRCNLRGTPYRILGYGGKQVRDNLHARDLARLVELLVAAPRAGEVYNVGGGRANSCSILEALESVEALTGRAFATTYVDEPRVGDHVCYYTDLRKAQAHHPTWRVETDLPSILDEICREQRARDGAA